MYDAGGTLLGGIKSMYIDCLTCLRVKEDESEQFRIDIGVSVLHHVPLAFQCIYMDAVMKEEDGDGEEKDSWEIVQMT